MRITRRQGVVVGVTALLIAAVGTGGAVALRGGSSSSAAGLSAAAPSAAPTAATAPTATPVTLVAQSVSADGAQPWDAPIQVTTADGQLVDVVAIGPDDAPVPGVLSGATWSSTGPLKPSTTYRLTATVRTGGKKVERPLVVRTSAPTHVLKAVLDPGDGSVVGVGLPAEVHLSAAVNDAAARAAVVQRLTVTTTPAVDGAWRWVSPSELHWRPAAFWAAGTVVDVKADLEGLALPGGVWGTGAHTTHYRIGDAVVSTADVNAHTLTVTRNGQVLRVLKASMGKPTRETRNGVDLVLEKNSTIVMDSDTVGLPGEYKTKVDWAVRLTYSGTFTHAAPWSVGDQGVRNVSHGCVNLAPADAKWFYDLVKRGDPVQVVGSPVAPLPHDPGSEDWNIPFEQWKSA
jgi:lipoprotein-anchoring transpeptidase ErfK/SrfK